MTAPDTLLLITPRELDTVGKGDPVEIEAHAVPGRAPVVIVTLHGQYDPSPHVRLGSLTAEVSGDDIRALRAGRTARVRTTGDAAPLTIDLFLGGIR